MVMFTVPIISGIYVANSVEVAMVVKEAAPITVDIIMVGIENMYCNLEYFS
jgi:hypothetical protein